MNDLGLRRQHPHQPTYLSYARCDLLPPGNISGRQHQVTGRFLFAGIRYDHGVMSL